MYNNYDIKSYAFVLGCFENHKQSLNEITEEFKYFKYDQVC